MNKKLLLSIATIGAISSTSYAGGDITPVAPIKQAPAPAACDFWGTLNFEYVAAKKEVDENGNKAANKFFKGDDEGTLSVVMGVEKQIGAGFGIGAEVAGIINFNIDDGKQGERAELSQLYLTYSANNNTIKAGRFALDAATSPLAFSDDTVGVKDVTFNGVAFINKSISDTTLVAAWIRSTTETTGSNKLGTNGLFMLGITNESIKDTTLSANLYYGKDILKAGNYISVWSAAQTKVGDIDLGLQTFYAKQKGNKNSWGVAGVIGSNFNGLDVALTLSYFNNTINIDDFPHDFWGEGEGEKVKAAKLELGYEIKDAGTVTGEFIYAKPKDARAAIEATVGYEFELAGMDASIEYTFSRDSDKKKNHEITLAATYKF